MLVSVDMRKIVYFLSLESFLFLSGSLLLLPPLLSEVIEPLGNVTWVGPGPIVASDLALFGLSPVLVRVFALLAVLEKRENIIVLHSLVLGHLFDTFVVVCVITRWSGWRHSWRLFLCW